MVKCSFCGDELPQGGGKLFAKKDGTVYYFCTGKCEKNFVNLKRKSTKTKWTNEHNKLKKTLLSAKKEKAEKK
jgi:large subunit ribosomal protein L24e